MASLISQGKSYTATNVFTSWFTDDGEKATNGTATGYGGTWAAHIGFYETAHVVTIDLAAKMSISHVRWNYCTFNAANILAEVSVVIAGSNNGTDWTDIGSYSASGNWVTDNAYWETGVWTDDLSVTGGSEYRYIRLTFPSPGAGVVADCSEYEVYGDAIISPTANYLKDRKRSRIDMRGLSQLT